jgi:hypothetical protein
VKIGLKRKLMWIKNDLSFVRLFQKFFLQKMSWKAVLNCFRNGMKWRKSFILFNERWSENIFCSFLSFLSKVWIKKRQLLVIKIYSKENLIQCLPLNENFENSLLFSFYSIRKNMRQKKVIKQYSHKSKNFWTTFKI